MIPELHTKKMFSTPGKPRNLAKEEIKNDFCFFVHLKTNEQLKSQSDSE